MRRAAASDTPFSPYSRTPEIDLGCHVLRVRACRLCSDLDRTGYHAVDAGFWVVLELVIRWTRIRFNLMDLSLLARLFLLRGPRFGCTAVFGSAS
jgi:hypothetical protein